MFLTEKVGAIMPIGLRSKRNKEINKVVLLPLDQIVPNPNQPRKYFDDESLQELSHSISVSGLLQPITVRQKADGKYEIIAGERRYMAFCQLGKVNIPAIVEEYTQEQSAVLALIENLQRKNLNYFEEAQGIARLMNELDLTQQQVSQRLGKAQSTVANKLRLLKYPLPLQERMIAGNLTERHARTLLKLSDLRQQEEAVYHIIENKLNVDQTERYVERILNTKKQTPGSRLFIVKDMRIFVNTIGKAVDMMNSAGISVHSAKRESEDYVEYVIKIPKDQIYKERPLHKKAL